VARRPDSTAELGGNTAPLSIEGDPDSATLAIEPDPIADLSDESSTIAGAVPGSPSLPFGPAKSPWAAFPQKASKSAVPLPPEDTGTAIEARAPLREVLPFGGNEKPVVRPPAPPLPGEPPRILLVDAPAQVIHEPRTAKLSEPEAPAPHAAEPPDKTAPAELAPLSDGLPLAEYPLERCAAIGASIARSKEDKSRILEANKLDAAAWAALDQHWNEAVLEETRRGKAALLWAYDAAYVARLEEERGPIRLEEYARISVAAERGALGDVLPEMSLPREAIMRIERVWLKKIAGDGTLGRSARRAVKTAREA
jgi:hypothetical protein